MNPVSSLASLPPSLSPSPLHFSSFLFFSLFSLFSSLLAVQWTLSPAHQRLKEQGPRYRISHLKRRVTVCVFSEVSFLLWVGTRDAKQHSKKVNITHIVFCLLWLMTCGQREFLNTHRKLSVILHEAQPWLVEYRVMAEIEVNHCDIYIREGRF